MFYLSRSNKAVYPSTVLNTCGETRQ